MENEQMQIEKNASNLYVTSGENAYFLKIKLATM